MFFVWSCKRFWDQIFGNSTKKNFKWISTMIQTILSLFPSPLSLSKHTSIFIDLTLCFARDF
ncbi:hypothetical protein KP509_03G095600 [Ceratopteris richardii]|uniref:Uncharacterized protein n=1 Tax=Ceratopteris richardii TaxID=49495 RepID=A0A8T2VDR9_CERRI|nr:hypothetical protein KP509_03G095600 [Ceratopteris richardii]